MAFAPQLPDCYLTQYGIPTINSSSQGTTDTGGAPNFTMYTPPLAFDPELVPCWPTTIKFTGKKVGVFGGVVTDRGARCRSCWARSRRCM